MQRSYNQFYWVIRLNVLRWWLWNIESLAVFLERSVYNYRFVGTINYFCTSLISTLYKTGEDLSPSNHQGNTTRKKRLVLLSYRHNSVPALKEDLNEKRHRGFQCKERFFGVMHGLELAISLFQNFIYAWSWRCSPFPILTKKPLHNITVLNETVCGIGRRFLRIDKIGVYFNKLS